MFIFFLFFLLHSTNEHKLTLDISAKEYMAMPLAIVADKNSELVDGIVYDGKISGQLDPLFFAKKLSNSTLNYLADNGYGLTLFIREKGDLVEWALYDTFSAEILISKKSNNKVALQHEIMNGIWPILFNKNISFNSVIAAVKSVGSNQSKNQIFLIFPFDKRKPVAVTQGKANCCAPRFHPWRSILYYSQHTPTNVRLVGCDLNTKSTFSVSSSNGLNMSPAINKDGKVVLVLAPHGTSSLYELSTKEGKRYFKRLTPANMQVISPSFMEDNILCCAFLDNRPYVMVYNFTKKSLEKLFSGSALAPAYCPVTKRVYFVKRVEGYLQVFYYDLATKKQVQLTNSKSIKDHPWPSSCGNFLVFTDIGNKHSSLVLYNLVTNSFQNITPVGEKWEAPVWSGLEMV